MVDLSPLWELGLTPGSSLNSAIHFSFDFTSLFLCGCLPSFYVLIVIPELEVRDNLGRNLKVYTIKLRGSAGAQKYKTGAVRKENEGSWNQSLKKILDKNLIHLYFFLATHLIRHLSITV